MSDWILVELFALMGFVATKRSAEIRRVTGQ